MNKVIKILVFPVLVLLALSSCKSKEERVIDKLDNLAEKVEKKSQDWDSEQWQKVLNEVEEIHSEMSECDFTADQLQKLGEVEGRLTTTIIKNGVSTLDGGINSYIERAGSFLNGFQEGIQDSSDESLEGIGRSINGALDKLKELDSHN